MLIIGSGYMTHGLPFLGRDSWERNVIPGWSRDFDAWAAEALAAGPDRCPGRLPARAGDAVRTPHGRALHAHLRHTSVRRPIPQHHRKSCIDDFQMGLAKRSVSGGIVTNPDARILWSPSTPRKAIWTGISRCMWPCSRKAHAQTRDAAACSLKVPWAHRDQLRPAAATPERAP